MIFMSASIREFGLFPITNRSVEISFEVSQQKRECVSDVVTIPNIDKTKINEFKQYLADEGRTLWINISNQPLQNIFTATNQQGEYGSNLKVFFHQGNDDNTAEFANQFIIEGTPHELAFIKHYQVQPYQIFYDNLNNAKNNGLIDYKMFINNEGKEEVAEISMNLYVYLWSQNMSFEHSMELNDNTMIKLHYVNKNYKIFLMQEKLNNLQNQLSSLATIDNTLQQQINSIQTQINTLQTVPGNTQELQTLNNAITTIQSDITTLESGIVLEQETLKTRLNKLENDYKNGNNNIKLLETIEYLKARQDELQQRIDNQAVVCDEEIEIQQSGKRAISFPANCHIGEKNNNRKLQETQKQIISFESNIHNSITYNDNIKNELSNNVINTIDNDNYKSAKLQKYDVAVNQITQIQQNIQNIETNIETNNQNIVNNYNTIKGDVETSQGLGIAGAVVGGAALFVLGKGLYDCFNGCRKHFKKNNEIPINAVANINNDEDAVLNIPQQNLNTFGEPHGSHNKLDTNKIDNATNLFTQKQVNKNQENSRQNSIRAENNVNFNI